MFELQALCQPLVDEYRIIARKKHLEVHFYSNVKSTWVYSDPMFCRRILQNLISNAVKYTAKGKVLLAIRSTGERLKVQVIDTGSGINLSEQSRVFDDFYRIDGSREQGVGLGLGVVSRMAKGLGLSVSVNSNVGRGSNFSFCLDKATAPENTKQSTQADRLLPSKKRRLNVLCIDDLEENVNAMQALLSRWDCEVSVALDTKAAIAQCQQQQPDLILADYQLGSNSNGIDLIGQLRAIANTQLPAVLITANSDEGLALRCESDGIFYHPKPVKPAKLRAIVNKVLREIR